MMQLKLLRDAMERALRRAENGELKLAVPRPCDIGERRPDMTYHLFPTVYLPFNGDLSLCLPEGEPTTVTKDMVGLISALQPHDFRVPPVKLAGFRCGSIRFRPNATVFLELMPRETMGLAPYDLSVLTSPLSARAADAATGLIDLRYTQLRQRRPVEQGLMTHLLGLVLNLIDDAEIHSPKVPTHPKVLEAWNITHLQAFDPGFTVEGLAEMVGLSADHLCRLYRADFDHPISGLIARLRLVRAKELLTHTTMNISEVAYCSGYRYPAYFTKLFRQRFGMTPTQYRSSILDEG